MDTLTVSPKTLTAELKPICAEVRKQTTPTKRRDYPLFGAVRLQAKDTLSACYLWDEERNMGPFPNPDAALDVLLDLDAAYALATILDAKKVASISVDTDTITGDTAPLMQSRSTTGKWLVVTQPSACPGRTDVMRFKVLEV